MSSDKTADQICEMAGKEYGLEFPSNVQREIFTGRVAAYIDQYVNNEVLPEFCPDK
jgi:hypothetical protein